jgi:hypothetical protein
MGLRMRRREDIAAAAVGLPGRIEVTGCPGLHRRACSALLAGAFIDTPRRVLRVRDENRNTGHIEFIES